MSQQTKQQTKNAALDVVDTVKRGDAPSNDQVTKVIDKTQQFLEEKKFDPNVAGTQVRLFLRLKQFCKIRSDSTLSKERCLFLTEYY
jgi:hypothetical protein